MGGTFSASPATEIMIKQQGLKKCDQLRPCYSLRSVTSKRM